MNNVELKSCPFCGEEAWLYSYEFHMGTGGYSVLCKNKNCPLVFGEREKDGYLDGKFDTKAEAIEAWNTRHERTVTLKGNGHCPDCNRLVGKGERYCAYCGARAKEESDANKR